MKLDTSVTAALLGIVSVYCIGMFPLLLSNKIDWAREAVALGAVLQVVFSFFELPIKVASFLGAASCAFIIFSPTTSYLLCCMVYGSFYASFLNKVEAPEKVLKMEFLGELIFLPVAAVCLLLQSSLTTLILVVGAVWWAFSMVWVPEVIETTSGNNIMFLSGWMCTAAVMSALLLTAIFVVSEVFSAEDQPKAVCIGLFLVMMGGCVSAVAFDSHPWYPVMLAGLVNSRLNSPFCNWVLPAQWCMGFSCIGVIVLDVSDYTMASLAYSLGVGMSSSMVAVRKAYAGSYSKLLALQKVAEVLPAILIATAGELTSMWVSVGLCIAGAVIFGIVRRRETKQCLEIEQQRVY